MAVYELEPGERLVTTLVYCGRLTVVTTHRLFEAEEVAGPEPWPGGAGSTLEIKPILREARDAESENTRG